MSYQWIPLASDLFFWCLLIVISLYFFRVTLTAQAREPWQRVLERPLAMGAAIVLVVFISIAALDSIHFQSTGTGAQGQTTTHRLVSVLDRLLSRLSQPLEKTYSAPLATHLFQPSLITQADGAQVRRRAPLRYVGTISQWSPSAVTADIIKRSLLGGLLGSLGFCLIAFAVIGFVAIGQRRPLLAVIRAVCQGKTRLAWRSAMLTGLILSIIMGILIALAQHYHVFGTDKIGNDVLYSTLKSIRTGILIGTLTTLFMLPFALLLGTAAGYFSGWLDDIIQYLYTTLSAIPGVLLISAAVLVLQVYMSTHSASFPTLYERADARLLALCLILGVTSWATLCRLLRAETLKLREYDYVTVARSLGVRPLRIMTRHIMPNVMHILLITVVIDFSGLVLAEAVLSYIGVGVDPTTYSWGNMINSARLELARDPVVWWPLVAAFIFMFLLVLAANLFADRVRDAFDPRLSQVRGLEHS